MGDKHDEYVNGVVQGLRTAAGICREYVADLKTDEIPFMTPAMIGVAKVLAYKIDREVDRIRGAFKNE